MGFLDGIIYNLRGLWFGIRTPKLLFWGLVRFAMVIVITIISATFILSYHQEILDLIWNKPESVWIVWLWRVLSWLLSLVLVGISAVISYLLSQILFSIVIMDYMSRITEKIMAGAVREPEKMKLLPLFFYLIKQEIPRAIIPVFVSLVLILGGLTPLGPVLTIFSCMIAAIFLALGASSVLRKAHQVIKAHNTFAISAGALAVLVCALPLFANYFYNDKSRNFLTYDYGVNIIRSMPSDGAIVFVDRDMEVFTLLFLKDVERICPNIEIIDRSGILRRDFYVKDMRLMPEKQRESAQLAAEHKLFKKETRPICYVPGVDLDGIKEFKLKPVGVATLLVPAKDAADFSERERAVPDTFITRSLEDPSIFKDYTCRCVAMVWELQLGDSYYWQGDHEKGKSLWRESSRTAGDIMILHTMLADKAVGCGETQIAVEEYNKIADIRPQDPLVRMNLGILFQREGRLDEALAAFDSARRINPTFLPALKACVNIEVKLKRFKKAIRLANQIAELAPRDPNALRNLGVVCELAGDYQGALAAYQRAVSVQPTFALAYADMGFLQEKMGHTDAAKDAMRRALALDPDLPRKDARWSQSSLAVELQKEGEASGTEDLSGLTADQLQSRMRALIAAKRYSQAIDVCKRLAQLRPKSAEQMIQMGILLDRTGRSQQAEAAFKKALLIDPNSAEAHNGLGVVYAKRKQYKDARREWEAALALKPDSAGTLSNLKQLEQLGY